MSWKNLFNQKESQETIDRIGTLSNETQGLWGKMDVAQMLAHCNVAYEIVHEPGKHAAPGFIGKFFANLFAKNLVISDDKPYPKSGPTAPMFVMKEDKDFDVEKSTHCIYR